MCVLSTHVLIWKEVIQLSLKIMKILKSLVLDVFVNNLLCLFAGSDTQDIKEHPDIPGILLSTCKKLMGKDKVGRRDTNFERAKLFP